MIGCFLSTTIIDSVSIASVSNNQPFHHAIEIYFQDSFAKIDKEMFHHRKLRKRKSQDTSWLDQVFMTSIPYRRSVSSFEINEGTTDKKLCLTIRR